MTKKVYLQPAIKFEELEAAEQLLAYSLHTSGLGDGEELTQDDTSGNAWDNAMSRRNAWNDDEEEW